jgi:hypothetical protein
MSIASRRRCSREGVPFLLFPLTKSPSSHIFDYFPMHKNPRLIYLAALGLLMFLGASGASAADKVTIVGGRSYKLGVLDEGSVARKTFILRNTAPDTLHLTAVGTSCGCTVARPGSKIIAPGDTTSIVVAFNTSGFDGPVRKQVFVRTSSTDEDSVVTITMDATVRAIIAIKPNFVNFYQAPRGKSVTKTFTVTNNSEKTITISAITCPDSMISFDKPTVKIKAHTSADISTTYKVTRRGHYINTITLHTNYPDRKELTISFIGDGI